MHAVTHVGFYTQHTRLKKLKALSANFFLSVTPNVVEKKTNFYF